MVAVFELKSNKMKKFLRGFARFLVGIVIVVELLLFMGLGAVRFRILNPSFWTNSFASSNTFTHIATQLQQTIQEGVPAEELDQEAINKTSEQIQTLLETNLERILSFLVDKDPNAKLLLYVPVEMLELPAEALAEITSEGISDETELNTLLPILGQEEEQIEKLNTNLDVARQVIALFPVVWAGLLVLLLLALIAFFFLGADKLQKIRGTGVIITVSGLLAVVIAVGVKQLAVYGLTNQPDIPPLVTNLIPELIDGFFSFGRNIGIGVAIVGGLVIAYTLKTKKGTKD